jgi:hypothetical protein
VGVRKHPRFINLRKTILLIFALASPGLGHPEAKVAVARKLAVILRRMWTEGSEFKWSSKEAANQPA